MSAVLPQGDDRIVVWGRLTYDNEQSFIKVNLNEPSKLKGKTKQQTQSVSWGIHPNGFQKKIYELFSSIPPAFVVKADARSTKLYLADGYRDSRTDLTTFKGQQLKSEMVVKGVVHHQTPFRFKVTFFSSQGNPSQALVRPYDQKTWKLTALDRNEIDAYNKFQLLHLLKFPNDSLHVHYDGAVLKVVTRALPYFELHNAHDLFSAYPLYHRQPWYQKTVDSMIFSFGQYANDLSAFREISELVEILTYSQSRELFNTLTAKFDQVSVGVAVLPLLEYIINHFIRKNANQIHDYLDENKLSQAGPPPQEKVLEDLEVFFTLPELYRMVDRLFDEVEPLREYNPCPAFKVLCAALVTMSGNIKGVQKNVYLKWRGKIEFFEKEYDKKRDKKIKGEMVDYDLMEHFFVQFASKALDCIGINATRASLELEVCKHVFKGIGTIGENVTIDPIKLAWGFTFGLFKTATEAAVEFKKADDARKLAKARYRAKMKLPDSDWWFYELLGLQKRAYLNATSLSAYFDLFSAKKIPNLHWFLCGYVYYCNILLNRKLLKEDFAAVIIDQLTMIWRANQESLPDDALKHLRLEREFDRTQICEETRNTLSKCASHPHPPIQQNAEMRLSDLDLVLNGEAPSFPRYDETFPSALFQKANTHEPFDRCLRAVITKTQGFINEAPLYTELSIKEGEQQDLFERKMNLFLASDKKILVIKGAANSGKSFSLLNYALKCLKVYDFSEPDVYLPLYAALGDLGIENVFDRAVQAVQSNSNYTGDSKQFYHGKRVWFFDGLDEVDFFPHDPGRFEIKNLWAVNNVALRYWLERDDKFVLAVRDGFCEDEDLLPKKSEKDLTCEQITLQPFNIRSGLTGYVEKFVRRQQSQPTGWVAADYLSAILQLDFPQAQGPFAQEQLSFMYNPLHLKLMVLALPKIFDKLKLRKRQNLISQEKTTLQEELSHAIACGIIYRTKSKGKGKNSLPTVTVDDCVDYAKRIAKKMDETNQKNEIKLIDTKQFLEFFQPTPANYYLKTSFLVFQNGIWKFPIDFYFRYWLSIAKDPTAEQTLLQAVQGDLYKFEEETVYIG